MNPLGPPLLTTRDVADHVGVSCETVLRRYRAGRLRGIRVGGRVLRFEAAAVDDFLARGARSALTSVMEAE